MANGLIVSKRCYLPSLPKSLQDGVLPAPHPPRAALCCGVSAGGVLRHHILDDSSNFTFLYLLAKVCG